MADVLDVVAVTPSRSEVTVYSVIGQPPSEAGVVHETTASTSGWGLAALAAALLVMTTILLRRTSGHRPAARP